MNWVDMQITEKAPYITEHIRYIDDNLFILPQDKIKELIEVANNILSPHIKYTYEVLDKDSEKGLPFLDTQLFISNEYTIESRLYTKPTDRHAYLLPSSYHPPHITKNIPLSVFYRLRRVCSREDWFKADVITAISWLEDRDYAYKDICRAIGKAIDRDRWELIESIEENRGKKKKSLEAIDNKVTIPLIVTYSQKTLQLKQTLEQRQDLLNASFVDTIVRPRISYRRQNNIGDTLVQKSLRGPIKGMIE